MSERLEFKGDYMGFTYNGKHSSELGIVRVSEGSRFNENLLPTMQDKTVQVPGGDGTYYFGSYYTQKPFNVSFAFDALTEQQVAELKRHFGDKGIHGLIFDETPYKVWSAKVTGTATIKYIPFDEGSTHRLYKGEGSIQFTCYYPFARCTVTRQDNETYKQTMDRLTWSEENPTGYKNINEWWDAAGIKWDRNFGDIDAPFTLKIWGTGSITDGKNEISWTGIGGSETAPARLINTKLGLVYNLDADGNPTTINLADVSGDLTMKIPAGAVHWKAEGDTETTLDVEIENGKDLLYDRYYF